MNDIQPLLSICIPTYNRAEYLKQTLNSIVENEGFCDDVEVVISDNCSTDNTEEVCKKFTQKYSNIKYFKQSQPTYIADQNFIDVLSFATGQYLKLHNDTAIIKKKILSQILNIIKQHVDSQTPIFFYQNYRYNNNISVNGTSLNDFVEKVSWLVMWISYFGCWKRDFDKLKQKDKYITFGLMQVDWTCRIVTEYGNIKIYFYDLYDLLKLKRKSGGYNIFKVFAYNYFAILKEYINKNILQKNFFELEKKRILFRFLIPTYVMTLYQKNFSFDTSKMFEYLIDYKKNWYFYLAICLLPVYFIVYGLIFLIKSLTANNYKIYHSLRKIKARLGI